MNRIFNKKIKDFGDKWSLKYVRDPPALYEWEQPLEESLAFECKAHTKKSNFNIQGREAVNKTILLVKRNADVIGC